MVYFWRSGYMRQVLSGSSGTEHRLVMTGIGERVRRVVLQAYIDLRNTDSGVIDQWIRHGVLSLLEATHGNPPPAPDPVRLGGYDTRDILYSEFHQVGNPQILVNTWSVPDPPGMITMDVEVSRGDGVAPVAVWWVWGLPNTSVAGVNAGYERFWYRCLVERI